VAPRYYPAVRARIGARKVAGLCVVAVTVAVVVVAKRNAEREAERDVIERAQQRALQGSPLPGHISRDRSRYGEVDLVCPYGHCGKGTGTKPTP
jgi:hypothetical protein